MASVKVPLVVLAVIAFPQVVAAQYKGQHTGLTWIVANVDHMIPYEAESVSLIASITGPRPAKELSRVLTADGLLLIAVPAADDLIELRELILGSGVARDRSAAVEEQLGEFFVPVDRKTIRVRESLSRQPTVEGR